MSDALIRYDENGRRIVPANILVRSMVRPTRMLAGTGIFKGVGVSRWQLSPSTAARVTKQAGQDAQVYLAQRLQAATDDIDAAETVRVEVDGCLIRTGTFRAEATSPSPMSIGEAALSSESAGPSMPTLLPVDTVRDVPRQKDLEWSEVRVGLARPLDEERPAEKLFVGKVASYPDLMTELKDAAGLVGLTDTSRVVAVADGANG